MKQDLDRRRRDGLTALHLAAMQGSSDIARSLLHNYASAEPLWFGTGARAAAVRYPRTMIRRPTSRPGVAGKRSRPRKTAGRLRSRLPAPARGPWPRPEPRPRAVGRHAGLRRGARRPRRAVAKAAPGRRRRRRVLRRPRAARAPPTREPVAAAPRRPRRGCGGGRRVRFNTARDGDVAARQQAPPPQGPRAAGTLFP